MDLCWPSFKYVVQMLLYRVSDTLDSEMWCFGNLEGVYRFERLFGHVKVVTVPFAPTGNDMYESYF